MMNTNNKKRKFEELLNPDFNRRKNASDYLSSKDYGLRPTSGLRLFDMCLMFVGEHVECVEHFKGFPSLIGSIIFNECIKLEKFNAEKSASSLIQTILLRFANDYPNLLINSINLSGQSKELLLFLKPILAICSIIEINLSDCKLNEIKEEFTMLNVLANSRSKLEYLNLSNNKLDGDFLQKFTVPQRLQTTDFSELTCLDLRENYKLKSLDFLKYLTKFNKLNQVYLSVPKDETIDKPFYGFQQCKCNKPLKANINKAGWFEKICLDKLIAKTNNSATQGK